MSAIIMQVVLDAPIGNEPQRGDGHINEQSGGDADNGQADSSKIEKQRSLAFSIRANDLFQGGVGALGGDDDLLQDPIGQGGRQYDAAVEETWQGIEMVFSHPGGCKGQGRQPKQQVQVGPEHATRHALAGLQHVMVIVPIDATINETQNIAEENGNEAGE
jgi:hypothetical protein